MRRFRARPFALKVAAHPVSVICPMPPSNPTSLMSEANSYPAQHFTAIW